MLKSFSEEAMRGKSENTIRSYLYVLRQFDEWLRGAGADLTTYGRVDVQQYIDYLVAHRMSASTLNKIFAAIKKFSVWAGSSPFCGVNSPLGFPS
jgi:integrase/recombinase XerD